MQTPKHTDPPFTIPPNILRIMIRVFVTPLILIYATFGFSFLALPLSVKIYGGVFANKWLWGISFILVAWLLSMGFADASMGRILRFSLIAAEVLAGMWLVADIAIVVISHINYVGPFVWSAIMVWDLEVIVAQSFANPESSQVLIERLTALIGRFNRNQQKG